MALGAEEGRDKLRKAAGRSTYPMIRRYPNGGTHIRQCVCILQPIHNCRKGTRGTETSKYPQEEKTTVIFLVAASERERGQTEPFGVRGCGPVTLYAEI